MSLCRRSIGLFVGLCLLTAGCAAPPAKTESKTASPATPLDSDPATEKKYASEVQPDGFRLLGFGAPGSWTLRDDAATPKSRQDRVLDAFFKLPQFDAAAPIPATAACDGDGTDALHPYGVISPSTPTEALGGGMRCALAYHPGARLHWLGLLADGRHYIAKIWLVDAEGNEFATFADMNAFAATVTP